MSCCVLASKMGGSQSAELDRAGQEEMGEVVGVFDTKFLGSVPVMEAKGDQVAADAIARTLKLKVKPQVCQIYVSVNGVFVRQPKTGTILNRCSLRELSFVSQV